MEEFGGLSGRDVRAVYLLAGACGELGAAPGQWCLRLSEGLEEALGVHISSLFEGSPAFVRGHGGPSPEDHFFLHGQALDSAMAVLGEYWAQNADGALDDPMLAAWREIGGPLATLTRRERVSDRTWRESAAYREFFRRAGLGDTVLARLPSGNGRSLLVNLWRASGDRSFTERDGLMVRLLVVELARMFDEGRLALLSGLRRPLSPRMSQVLALLREGLSEKQVAHELGISEHTVHNHVKRLHAALGASSRSQLLARSNHLAPTGADTRFGPLLAAR